MKSVYLLAVSTLVLCGLGLLSACDGGGVSRVRGNRCAENHNPIPMDVPVEQKLGLKPGADGLPPGHYAYERADLYYVDGKSDLLVHLEDVKQKDGSFKASTACVRNMKEETSGIVMAADGANTLTVSSDSKMTADVKQYGFSIENGNINFNFVNTPRPGLGSPSEIYDGKVLESFVFKHSDTDYEIRSMSDVIRDGEVVGRYYLSTRFKRQDAPPVPPPLSEPPT
ncbi:MAG: hypothetical protein AB7G93_02730 [Bdellovibrionales bacterium]